GAYNYHHVLHTQIDLKGDLHACKECEASISLVHGHLNHRKECINALVKIWGHSSLLRTQFRAEPLLESNKCKL
ncbi:MAG: hypothetical protein MJE68_02090, partial [Proteobacteria bacterium]|nr:hypothetical protein [Pseudomonadota bacterium]